MSWLERLKPQLEEHLDKLSFQGYYAEQLREILQDDNWMKHECFESAKFNYRKAEWTLEGLCDTYSLFTSDLFGGDAIKGALKWQLLELIKSDKYQMPDDVKEQMNPKEEVA